MNEITIPIKIKIEEQKGRFGIKLNLYMLHNPLNIGHFYINLENNSDHTFFLWKILKLPVPIEM